MLTESDREDVVEPTLARSSWPRRLARFVLLISAVLLLFVVGSLGPSWIRVPKGSEARALQRMAAIGFLDGLLVAYCVALVAICTMLALAYVQLWRQRSRRIAPRDHDRKRRARWLFISLSLLPSVLILEVGAAAWQASLYRSPRLPAATLTPEELSAQSGIKSAPEMPTRFTVNVPEGADAKGRGPLRILVIGESSARGEPYHPWLSVGQIVAWRLERVFPGQPIQVDIWAYGGATLAVMHDKLAGLTDRPDVLMLYVGHNEFQGRYAWMREADYYRDDDQGVSKHSRTGNLIIALSRISPVCRLIREARERQQVDIRPPRAVTRELVDSPVCTTAEADGLVADFRRRLSEIATFCESIGTLPIFIIPASNDGGYDPSRSILTATTPRVERVAFARSMSQARALELKDRAQAIQIYRELLGRHPEFAETHFRLARLMEQTGRWDEAKVHYVEARERDAMPLRCPEAFRKAYREVAHLHPWVLLVDGPRVLEAASLHGILDDTFFHDAQHPNLRGYTILAENILNQLHARGALGWPSERPIPIVDIRACIRHFQLDAARWIEICRREVWFYQATAYIRYDPKFRNQRAAAYTRAMEALQAGCDPADAAIPGWSLPPKPRTSRRLLDVTEPRSK